MRQRVSCQRSAGRDFKVAKSSPDSSFGRCFPIGPTLPPEISAPPCPKQLPPDSDSWPGVSSPPPSFVMCFCYLAMTLSHASCEDTPGPFPLCAPLWQDRETCPLLPLADAEGLRVEPCCTVRREEMNHDVKGHPRISLWGLLVEPSGLSQESAGGDSLSSQEPS